MLAVEKRIGSKYLLGSSSSNVVAYVVLSVGPLIEPSSIEKIMQVRKGVF